MATLHIKIDENIIDDNSIVAHYKNRTNQYFDDSGLDLVCPEETIIVGGETVLVDTGIACEMIIKNAVDTGVTRENYVIDNIGFQLYSRSSICKTPLILANGVGVVDAGYRGNIKCAFRNTNNVVMTNFNILVSTIISLILFQNTYYSDSHWIFNIIFSLLRSFCLIPVFIIIAYKTNLFSIRYIRQVFKAIFNSEYFIDILFGVHVIEKGERIAQIVPPGNKLIAVEISKILSSSLRGSNGFGSTGKNLTEKIGDSQTGTTDMAGFSFLDAYSSTKTYAAI